MSAEPEEPPVMEECGDCGTVFEGVKGLASHQAQTDCGSGDQHDADDYHGEAAARTAGGVSWSYRMRCPHCDYVDRTKIQSRALRRQKNGCPNCGHGVGISKVRADPEKPILTDGGTDEWHPCDLCGAKYRNAQAAMDCCSDRLDDVDRGEGIRTDGGQTVGRRESDVTFYQACCTTCDKQLTPRRRKSKAKTDRKLHKQKEHDSLPHVSIVEFESDAIGPKALERPDYDELLGDGGDA